MERGYRSWVAAWLVLSCGGCMSPVATDEYEAPEVASSGAALVGDGDLREFPPWLWPYIRTTAIFSEALAGAISIKQAKIAMQAAAEECGCALATSKADAQVALAAVSATFDAQYAAARLALAASRSGGSRGAASSMAMSEEDGDWCGSSVLPKFKWPGPRVVDDLLSSQRELLGKAVLSNVQFDERGRAELDSLLDSQAERFESLGM